MHDMLTGDQQKRLRQTILDYYLPDDFIVFLEYNLDKKWHLLVSNNKFPHQVTQLITQSNYGRWYKDLVLALLKDRPDAKGFAYLAYELSLANIGYAEDPAAVIDAGGLEAMVNKDVMFDVNAIVNGIVTNKKCVCRIEIQGDQLPSFGTGFLVGPDKVLTNYHVVEALFKDQENKLTALCRFDFEVQADGSVGANGSFTTFKLSSIIAHSVYSDADATGVLGIHEPGWPADQLDYALIQLGVAVGNEEVPYLLSSENNKVQNRGWIKAGAGAHEPYSPNFIILQHPKGRPMKVAIGLNRALGLSVNKTRIRYNVNTMQGSSGSPCFDEKFNWIALHNMGDPDWNPAYNQGITSAAIIKDLNTKGIVL